LERTTPHKVVSLPSSAPSNITVPNQSTGTTLPAPSVDLHHPEPVSVPNPTESLPASTFSSSTVSESPVGLSITGSPGNPNVLRRISKKVPAPKPPTAPPPQPAVDVKLGSSIPPSAVSPSSPAASPKIVRPRETPPPRPHAPVERPPPPPTTKPSLSSSSENVATTDIPKLYPTLSAPDAEFAVPEKPAEKQHRRQASDSTPYGRPARPMPPPPPPPANPFGVTDSLQPDSSNWDQ